MIITREKHHFHNSIKFLDAILCESLKRTGVKFFVAGGYFVSHFCQQSVRDIDFFFETHEDFEKAYTVVKGLPQYQVTLDNDWVVNILVRDKHKMQFVKKFNYDHVNKLFDAFDFTICKFAYDGINCYYPLNYFQHVVERRLIIEGNPRYPLAVIKRALKYSKRGFTFEDTYLKDTLKAINSTSINFQDPDQTGVVFYEDSSESLNAIKPEDYDNTSSQSEDDFLPF